jgi:hypothetical protein
MDAATLVWIAPAPQSADQARALASYARAHGVVLSPPTATPQAALAVDPRLPEDVERLLDRARDALAARDSDAVDRLLGAADATLRAHPELPQASWLLAEVLRARATRLRRMPPVDEAGAAAAWAQAEALDGGRLAGVGEQIAPSAPPATFTLPAGLFAGATVRIDGVVTTSPTLTTRAGPHAVVVAIDGAPVWASWIDVPAGTSTAGVNGAAWSAGVAACSRVDLSRASLAGDTVDAAGIRCPAWLAASDNPAGSGASASTGASVRVAVCAMDHCGPLVAWQAPLPWTYQPPPQPAAGRWPTWATWGLVGAGAVVATGIVIVATGVLKPAPTETQYVTGGLRTQ